MSERYKFSIIINIECFIASKMNEIIKKFCEKNEIKIFLKRKNEVENNFRL